MSLLVFLLFWFKLFLENLESGLWLYQKPLTSEWSWHERKLICISRHDTAIFHVSNLVEMSVWSRQVGQGREGFTEPTDWMCIVDESARVWQWPLQTQVLVRSVKKTWTKPLSNLISVKHEAQVHPRRQRRTDRQIQSTSLVEWPETRRWSMEENKFIPVKPSPFSKICHLWHWNRPFTQFVQIPVMWFLSSFFPIGLEFAGMQVSQWTLKNWIIHKILILRQAGYL